MIGNFLGTLIVYVVLLVYRRYQLGLQFDRELLRAMNRFGLPLVPAALALWAINFIDRFFIDAYKGQAEVGIYSLAVRIASVIVFLMTAFQLAWPAFAYSIRTTATRSAPTPTCSPTCCFSPAGSRSRSALLAPWIVDLLAPNAGFERAADAVPLLCFVVGGVLRLHGARDRHRPRAADAVQLDRQRRSPQS